MKNKTLATLKYGIMAMVTALAVSQVTATAQEPVEPEGNKIMGTWNMQVQFRDCATGNPLPVSGPTIVSYSQGGVITEMAQAVLPSLRSPALGVWQHVQGRNYAGAFKVFRFNPDGTFAGKTIVFSDIRHELDDTLTSSAVANGYDSAGNLVSTVCPTAVGTRFTGED